MGKEECDDVNDTEGDECFLCELETWSVHCPDGYLCEPLCGNGVAGVTIVNTTQVIEECDDGNRLSGDGCSATCTIAPGYVCDVAGGTKCHAVVCGDRVQDYAAQCDDGNAISGHGCDSRCHAEVPPAERISSAFMAVQILPKPQQCAFQIADFFEAQHGNAIHVQILLSGDALQTNVVTVELEVESGVWTWEPLLDKWAKVTETDCAVDALLWRQTQITLTPFLLSGNFTVLPGPTLQMSRFLDENVYIQPDRHFRGIVKVPTENIAKDKAPLPSRKDKIRGHLRRLLDENESSRRNAAL